MSILNVRNTLFIASLVLLSACGSSGSDDAGLQPGANALGDIVGVWDLSADSDTIAGPVGYDEAYLVITADGGYFEYDFLGDEFATLDGINQNCYEKTTEGTITDSGNGSFLIDIVVQDFTFIEQSVNYSVAEGRLSAPATLLNPGGAHVSIPSATSVTLADIESMLCE